MKLAVIYHSESGNTAEVAEIIKKGAEKIDGVIAEAMHIDEIDMDFAESAQAFIFGTPTYSGDLTWQLKNWFANSNKINLSGKLGAAFATQRYVGGGATNALKNILGHLIVKGMLAYSVGSAEGKPYTHYGAVCIENGSDDEKKRAEIFGERVAKKAVELFG